MALDLSVVGTHWKAVLVGVSLVFLIKMITSTVAVLLLGYPIKTAFISGALLCQAGELSFVLALSGFHYGIISITDYQIYLAIAVTTMLLSPFTTKLGYRLGPCLPSFAIEWFKIKKLGDSTGKKKLSNHLVFIGGGISNHLGIRYAEEAGRDVVVVDMNPKLIGTYIKRDRVSRSDKIRAGTTRHMVGDGSKGTVLSKAGVADATTIVIAVSDQNILPAIVATARSLNKKATIICRCHFIAETGKLKQAGATVVVPTELTAAPSIAAEMCKSQMMDNPSGADIERLTQCAVRFYQEM